MLNTAPAKISIVMSFLAFTPFVFPILQRLKGEKEKMESESRHYQDHFW